MMDKPKFHGGYQDRISKYADHRVKKEFIPLTLHKRFVGKDPITEYWDYNEGDYFLRYAYMGEEFWIRDGEVLQMDWFNSVENILLPLFATEL